MILLGVTQRDTIKSAPESFSGRESLRMEKEREQGDSSVCGQLQGLLLLPGF